MFDSIKNFLGGSSARQVEARWKQIQTEEEVGEILVSSNTKLQVIYKHSTRCAVSFMALRNLHQLEDEDWEMADFYMVDVIQERALSQFIAEKLGIRHESPQVMILKDGAVLWAGSHYQVNAEALQTYLS